MKSMVRSSRSAVHVKQSTPATRPTVAIAVSPERTNVSVPNTAEALVATGALLFFTGLIVAALNDE